MWDVLAIAPTDDQKVIRRAYAARLRQIDPDREREAFARLRQALEWALAGAKQPPRRVPQEEPARDPAPTGDTEPKAVVEVAQALQPRYDVHVFPPSQPPAVLQSPAPAAPVVAEERANERALLIGLESALQRRDAREASQLYCRAAATGALPLGDAERMLARLFGVALEDPKLDGAAFRALAKSFGWDRPELAGPVTSEVRRRVTARLAAEDWYDELVGIADRKRWWFTRYKSRVARLMLKRIRGRALLHIDRAALQATLDTFKPHELWLRDRISPEWVATLQRRLWWREWIARTVPMVILTFLLLGAAFVIVGGLAGLIKDEAWFAIAVLIGVTALLGWMLPAVARHFVAMWHTRR
jgi:hypothetical protein